jgi:hypothetical protein
MKDSGSNNRLMEITPSADHHLRSFLVCPISGMEFWSQSAAISSASIHFQSVGSGFNG